MTSQQKIVNLCITGQKINVSLQYSYRVFLFIAMSCGKGLRGQTFISILISIIHGFHPQFNAMTNQKDFLSLTPRIAKQLNNDFPLGFSGDTHCSIVLEHVHELGTHGQSLDIRGNSKQSHCLNQLDTSRNYAIKVKSMLRCCLKDENTIAVLYCI